MDSHIDNYKKLIQELQHKNKMLESELQTLSTQPRVVDLSAWLDKIRTLYNQKKAHHHEILTLESKEKLLRWKIKYKCYSAEIINNVDNSENEVSLGDR